MAWWGGIRGGTTGFKDDHPQQYFLPIRSKSICMFRRSENSQAHRLAKEALDKGESSYQMGEELNRHIFFSERRRQREPD
ncbi:hypothetical protein J1N35_024808 [Gossypium stocksii]|uniref:Uncharacterized protein n=1 Tax=Gossypium stocksii TaxID=47602 RepID=A0A9D3ZVM5_9ROSI|nr:hypothetical protein J1N35_024808 [Gossypium stocksii]